MQCIRRLLLAIHPIARASHIEPVRLSRSSRHVTSGVESEKSFCLGDNE
jgi:hypothetical protein